MTISTTTVKSILDRTPRASARWISVFAVLAAALSVHCGGDAAGVDAEGAPPADVAGEAPPPKGDGSGKAGDEQAPAIVSITPANGSVGVRSDAAIVVEFSEPMDRASVEAAYASAKLPKDAVAFAWNVASTELTITPKSPLSYDVGGDVNAPANKYVVAIGVGAKDAAGNALATEGASEFSTLREIFLNAPLVADLSGRTSGNTATKNPAEYYVGDGSLDGALMSFFTFDLAGVPEGAEVVSATFATRQTGFFGTPFADLGAKIDLARTSYATFNAPTLLAAVPAEIGPLSTTTDVGARELDVTAAVTQDLAERAANQNRSQFRLAFPLPTDGEKDVDRVDYLQPGLSVTVLAK